MNVKQHIWLTNVKYLWLSLNTSCILIFCIDTHVCTVIKVIGINKEKEICLLNIQSGHQVPIFFYFFSKFLFSPIFQQNSYFFLFFSQFAVEFYISGFFSGFIFFSIATHVLKELHSGKISPVRLFG